MSAVAVAALIALTAIAAQVPGRNTNMVAGTTYPDGDPHLQRQNEPSIAASTRNPLHMLGGSNDYRTVDIPFPNDDDEETGDAWLGLYKSYDGAQRWKSGLLPGYPQDQSDAGLASPLKAYKAGADPVVRAGTHGMLYYSGLAFDRGPGGKSAIFLARFIDNNNKENGDPIAYLGTSLVATASGATFLDKPWMAVDIPRGDGVTCVVTENNVLSTVPPWKKYGKAQKAKKHTMPPGGQRIPAGAIYVAYTAITGEGATLKAEILLTRSMDCGRTWATPMKVSRPEDGINQGANITIDPRFGTVYIAWRRFSAFATAQNPNPPDSDAIMMARLPYGGKKLDPPCKAHDFGRAQAQRTVHQLEKLFEHRPKKKADDANVNSEEVSDIEEFDQGSTGFRFRTNAYPTMTADGSGRVYIAWAQRGFRTDTALFEGARIVMMTTRDGRTFTQPNTVDEHNQLGHQLMPTVQFAGGKLLVVYYDLRETRANSHTKFASDFGPNGLRQTIDIRAAMASAGDYPQFNPSVKVSDYLQGINPRTGLIQDLQVNPPNLPMFRQGTTPFMGDYIDVTAAPVFVPTGNGKWGYNTAASGVTPVWHATWTDNRDVRPPKNGDWTQYTPASMSSTPPGRDSLFDPTIKVPACENGNAGSRNQNVYSARITQGLLVGSPGNAKPLSPTLQRAFVVFAQNTTNQKRSFRMSIRNQPPGGRASFEQFATSTPLTVLDLAVPARSTGSRSVYATSTNDAASIIVDVVETTSGGGVQSLNLAGTIMLNPDPENPDVENPDPENTDPSNPDVENAEVYNPDVENPDVENPDVENTLLSLHLANPDVENPDVENPDPENPDVENVLVANPDIENPNVINPDVENPDVENPDIENPDVENPDVENGAVADVTWQVTNTGNTTSAFNVNIFLAQNNLPAGVKTQLILYKTYRTPATVPNGCQLGFQTRNVLLMNILHPTFITPESGGVADQNDPTDKNATMWLAPGEEGRITLRVIDDDLSNNLIITKDDGTTVNIDPVLAPTLGTTPAVSSQGVDTLRRLAGETEPPLITPTGSNLFFLTMPGNGITGVALSPAVRVQVRDNHTGSPVPDAVVTLSLGSNPSEASLTGNVATADATGIATFPLLTVSAAGSGFTIRASASIVGVIATAESAPFDIAEYPPVVIEVPSAGERTAQTGVEYALTLSATGGIPPYTWFLDSGTLPPGFVLNSATGVISGTTQVTGGFNFTVRAVDSFGVFDTQLLCITVVQPPATDITTTSVGETLTIENLVTSLLGQGVEVSNIRLTGPGAAAGVFEGGGGILGIDTGVILSTGSVHDARGPNDSDLTTSNLGGAGDEDLTALSGHPTFDATVLTFDFIPSGNTVKFRYVFGSEEYNEFAATQFNDAFGFFITDPEGITRNWALVPGTEDPVTINSINGGNPYGAMAASHPELFRNNDLTDGGGSINIEADGLTVVLTLTASVTPGALHTMKLAIADAGDSSYDSWVFIEGGSFHAVENCANGIDDDGDGLIDAEDPDCAICQEQPILIDGAVSAASQAIQFVADLRQEPVDRQRD